MNNLLQRLRPLDYALLAALIVVGLLLFAGGNDDASPGGAGTQAEAPALSWGESIRAVVTAVSAGDLSAARAAFLDAAETAREEGEPGTARAIEAAAGRLNSLDLRDLESIFGPAANEQIGPLFLQFLLAVNAAVVTPDFPSGTPRNGNAWGEVLTTAEDIPSELYWSPVSWSPADTPLALLARLEVGDIGLTADLAMDFAQPGLLTLVLNGLDAGIEEATVFFLMSPAGLLLVDLDDASPVMLPGKVDAVGNRIEMQFEPEGEIDAVAILEAAPELMTTVRLDDGGTLLVRFQINTTVRERLRRIHDRLLGGAY